MSAKQNNLVVVIINKNNIITSVSTNWNAVATEGKAIESLENKKIVGQSIESFFGGDVTKMYYEAVFTLCRLKNETITRNYRCDSPTHERYMQMTLIPFEEGIIEMNHETIKEVPFKNNVNIKYIKNDLYNSTAYTKRCSVCNRLLYPDTNNWVFPETLNQKEPLYIKVIHTVCSNCKKRNWLPSK